MCIKSLDNARLIFKIFGPKKPLDIENKYKVYRILEKFSNAIFTHLETFFFKKKKKEKKKKYQVLFALAYT